MYRVIVQALEVATVAVSLGSVETLVTRPALDTHLHLGAAGRKARSGRPEPEFVEFACSKLARSVCGCEGLLDPKQGRQA